MFDFKTLKVCKRLKENINKSTRLKITLNICLKFAFSFALNEWKDLHRRCNRINEDKMIDYDKIKITLQINNQRHFCGEIKLKLINSKLIQWKYV